MPIIDIQNVTKTYNPDKVPVHALKGVNLQIEKGAFAAIVGPSGSGKTTLLNVIGGLDEPTSGTLAVNGVTVNGLPERELTRFRLRHIGFVFQAYNLIPVLTAKENVAFILQIQGKSSRESYGEALRLLEAVGISEKADKRPSELSGGQQQRVAVARALASKPDFVLADEPTANLDSQSAATLLDIMERLNRDEGMTFVFSTHDQRVVDRARRVITLVDGAVAKDEVKT